MNAVSATPLLEHARRRPRLAAALGVTVIVVVSALVRIALAANVAGPWIFVDELIYSELGRTAFSGFAIRGVPVGGYGNVYPFVIAPAYWLFENLVTAYAAVKVINSIVMSLAAIPVYFMARTMMARRWALVASALAVLVPGMAYTGMVMTESAFYPAFALSAMAGVFALQRRSFVWQITALASAVLCFEIRQQGGVAVFSYIASVCLLIVVDVVRCADDNRVLTLRRSVRAFLPTFGALALFVAAAVVYLRSQALHWSSLLGAYGITVEERDRYQIRPVVSWFLLHLAELDLWLGIVPFAALLIMVGVALRSRVDPSVRAFACAALPAIVSMTALVAAFVVFANVSRIEERNLFYVGVYFVVAGAWWASKRFEHGLQPWSVVVVVAVSMAPVALPFGSLLTLSAVSDTFGVFLPYAVNSRIQDPTITTFAVFAGVILLVALLVTQGASRPWIVIAAVVAFLVLTGAAVDRRTDKAAAAAVAIESPQDWIDAAVGPSADVAVVFPGSSDPMRVWQAEFFNRSLGTVYTISTPLAGALPDMIVDLRPSGAAVDRSGQPVSARYVLTDIYTAIAGRVVARDQRHGMVLYETSGPIVVGGLATGLYGDGWSTADVVYTRYGCTGGTVRMEASENASIHPSPVTVTPYVGDEPQGSVSVSADVGSVQVPARVQSQDGVCQVRFHVDPLITPAAAIGSTDDRPLGVIVRGFSYQPDG